MRINQKELNLILGFHLAWILCSNIGEKANLRSANLSSANLRSADLSYADLRSADLRSADLRSAYLNYADLRSADLRSANLNYADLRSADLDYSAYPLWCGTKGMKVDLKIVLQLMAHICVLKCTDEKFTEIKKLLLPYAKESHRAKDLGIKR